MAKGGGRRRGLLGLGEVVKGDGILGFLRGYNGKENLLLLLGRKRMGAGLREVEKRARREKAVKMTSGSEVAFLRRRWCGGGIGGWGGGGGGMTAGDDGGWGWGC